MIELTVTKAGKITPATLVSLVPFPIKEDKPGLIPSEFVISASVNGRPSVKVIGEAFHDVYIDAARGSMRVRNPPYDVARAIVYDYLVAQLEISENAHPAFFYVDGEHTTETIEKHFPAELLKYRKKQIEWFKNLVMRGNDDWEKTRSHYAISDTQRFAAEALGLEVPWKVTGMTEEEMLAPKIRLSRCPGCTTQLPEDVVICPHCRCIINTEKHKKLAFAG